MAAWEQITKLTGRLSGNESGDVSDTVVQPLRQEPLYEKLFRRVTSLVGLPATIAATFGLRSLSSLKGRHQNEESTGAGPGRQARAMLLSWLGAGALFLLLDQALGDSIRWYYLVAAAIALLAGRFMSALTARGRNANLLVALTLSVMLVELLTTWVGDLIFIRYHELPLGK